MEHFLPDLRTFQDDNIPMKTVIVLLLALSPVFVSAQQSIDFDQLTSYATERYVYLCGADSMFDASMWNAIKKEFGGKAMKTGDGFFYRELASDTSVQFITMQEMPDKKHLQLVVYRGGRAFKSAFPSEPYKMTPSSEVNPLVVLQLDLDHWTPQTSLMYFRSIRKMIAWGSRFATSAEMLERTEHLEWVAPGSRLLVDQDDLSKTGKVIVERKTVYPNLSYISNREIELLITNKNRDGVYLDRQEMTFGEKSMVVWYFYQPSEGLSCMFEEEKVEDAESVISLNHFKYIFQEKPLLPGKSPKDCGRTIFTPVRQ